MKKKEKYRGRKRVAQQNKACKELPSLWTSFGAVPQRQSLLIEMVVSTRV